MATAGLGVATPAASADGGTVTTSLHIATADANPTPTLNALAVSVAARSLSGARQFDIRLDPPELGRVDVRLSIDASGKTEAHMTADQPQTLDLLQKDAPTLTQALRDAGLDVSQSGLNFSLRGQDRQNDNGGNGAGQGRRTNLTATRTIQATQSSAAISFNGAAADARVDIHV
jgi:flagellar hook-length control protein FliK